MARWASVLLAILLILPAAAAAETRVALVIGNGGYAANLGTLRNPPADANAIAAALRQAKFDVILKTDLDIVGMRAAIQQFRDRIKAGGTGTTALFYYAGHAMEDGRQNYLIPLGAAPAVVADLELEALAAETVMFQMDWAGARRSILILDACRDLPLLRRTRGGKAGLREIAPPEDAATEKEYYFAFATRAGSTAADGDTEHSPFTAAMLNQFKVPGLDIKDFFQNVRREVRETTGGRQDPWDTHNFIAPFELVVNVNVTVNAGAAPAAAPGSYPGVTGQALLEFASVPTETATDRKVAAAPYLRGGAHAIKLRDVSPPGSEVVFMNNRALYEGRAVIPTISQNMLTQTGTGNVAASFTLVLPEAASRVQFLVPRLYPDTESGVTFPAWTATALSASGAELDTRKRALARRMEADIPGDLISLDAPAFEGIAAIRFESDPRLGDRPFAAFSGILIEGLWFVPISGQKR